MILEGFGVTHKWHKNGPCTYQFGPYYLSQDAASSWVLLYHEKNLGATINYIATWVDTKPPFEKAWVIIGEHLKNRIEEAKKALSIWELKP